MGFFTWFAFAFITIPQIGAAVGVSQSIGRKDLIETKSYIRHSLQLNIVLAVLYGATMIIFRKQLIGFRFENSRSAFIDKDAWTKWGMVEHKP